ncbi:Uu.00g112960.m01.CDS01 [Anthostomella pinea]|uniref:Uu.00g112960.m01.CDS01 n=1 Tax=Anthostomella pinea TaxID=933095 RepID=A0AAI8YGM7_9PEZI|nr:Uu.00g112960.m01.CDS01 [Anthostomella pinea]
MPVASPSSAADDAPTACTDLPPPIASQIDQEELHQDKESRPRARGRGKGTSAVRRLNIHKRHLAGNRVLTEDAESLGSNMLGKPAYAIVMRDGGFFKKRKNQSVDPLFEPESDQAHANLANIEAMLDSQRNPPTAAEARRNIDELRPKTDTTLSAREFQKVKELLIDGFLSSQLQDYLERWKGAHKHHHDEHELPTTAADHLESDAMNTSAVDLLESDDEGNTTAVDTPEHDDNNAQAHRFSWINNVTPWVPLRIQGDADPSLQGYITNSASTKERLAVRIMRECWGLSIAELSTGLGETRVRIRNREFILLMRGTQRFVNTVGKIRLDAGEKIESFRNQKTLRLVTTKPKAEMLLQDFDEILNGVHTRTLPVKLFATEPPDDAVLEELGRITNSDVRKSHNGERLHVTWIELKARAKQGLVGLEDMRHIVARLLLTAFAPPRATSTLYAVNAGNDGRLIPHVAAKHKLNWLDKMAHWARYVLPLAPETGTPTPTTPPMQLELPFEPRPALVTDGIWEINEGDEFFPETAFPAHPVRWSENVRTSTAAHFGHILHPHQPTTASSPRSQTDLLVSNDRRVFSPITPHPLHLANFGPSQDKTRPQQPAQTRGTLLLRFWPSPEINVRPKALPDTTEEQAPGNKNKKKRGKRLTPRAGMPPAPVLELRIAVSEYGDIEGIESLQAIRHTHHTNVMLPASPVDVRFTQTQYALLEGADSATLAAWQPLADFLGSARFDLQAGKLEMPPRQAFPVPRRLFADEPDQSPTASGQQTNGQGQAPDSHALVNVLYEFVGLELHRSVALPHEDGGSLHRLAYTSIEAGQGGGRRAELTLEPLAATPSGGDGNTWPAASPPPEGEGEREGEREMSDATSDKQQDDFLACCYRLATSGSLWSGSVVPPSRKT